MSTSEVVNIEQKSGEIKIGIQSLKERFVEINTGEFSESHAEGYDRNLQEALSSQILATNTSLAEIGTSSEWIELPAEEQSQKLAESIKEARLLLLEVLKYRGFNELELITPAGIQGAGKGTVLDTLKVFANQLMSPSVSINPRDLREIDLIRKIEDFAQIYEIKTGTNGVTIPNDSEYKTTCGPLQNLGADKGNFINDSITTLAVTLMISHKILSGKPSEFEKGGKATVILDFYPRSRGQITDLFEFLEENNHEEAENNYESDEIPESTKVKIKHTFWDVHLLSEEDVELLYLNRDKALEFIPKLIINFEKEYGEISTTQESWIKSTMTRLDNEFAQKNHTTQEDIQIEFNKAKEQLTGVFGFESYEQFQGLSKSMSSRNFDIRVLLFREAETAIDRASDRRWKTGRLDDTPGTILKRLYSYYKNTFSVALSQVDITDQQKILKQDKVIPISNFGSPVNASLKIFNKLFNISELVVDPNIQLNFIHNLQILYQLNFLEKVGLIFSNQELNSFDNASKEVVAEIIKHAKGVSKDILRYLSLNPLLKSLINPEIQIQQQRITGMGNCFVIKPNKQSSKAIIIPPYKNRGVLVLSRFQEE